MAFRMGRYLLGTVVSQNEHGMVINQSIFQPIFQLTSPSFPHRVGIFVHVY